MVHIVLFHFQCTTNSENGEDLRLEKRIINAGESQMIKVHPHDKKWIRIVLQPKNSAVKPV